MASRQSTLLVVGSGITGSVTAALLARAGVQVALWDKAAGVGGRMATHRYPENPSLHVDMGAQYVTTHDRDDYDSAFQRFKRDTYADLTSNGLLSPLIGTIDGEATPARDGGGSKSSHWVSRDGLNSIAKYYLRSAGVVPLTRRVLTGVDVRGDKAVCSTASGESHEFDAVVLTMPVPQLLALGGTLVTSLDPDTLSKLQSVSYSSRYALGLFYDRPASGITWTAKYVRDSPVLRFLCWDDAKRESNASTRSVLLAHSAVEFAKEHLEMDKAQVQALMTKAIERECPDLSMPLHTHLIRWRYSQVTSGYPASPGAEMLSSCPPVVATGDAFSRSNFDGCLYAAYRATDAVLSSLGKSKKS